jgi:hypothetical protein
VRNPLSPHYNAEPTISTLPVDAGGGRVCGCVDPGVLRPAGLVYALLPYLWLKNPPTHFGSRTGLLMLSEIQPCFDNIQ